MAIKCTELVYTALNALAVRISGGAASLIPHKLNDRIISLESPDDGICVTIGSITEIKKNKYFCRVYYRS